MTLRFLLLSCIYMLGFLALSGCSLNYDRGVELEADERWEESAIEYRKAFVDKPDQVEIQEALMRVNRKIASENLARYRVYLQKNAYKKAYQRLHAALVQNPEMSPALDELQNWTQVLLTGKVDLEFESLGKNLRIAEEMQLVVLINTPSGKIISSTISNDTGIFFTEDLAYRKSPEQLAQYSLNSIGLRLKQKTNRGFIRHIFDKFINFRTMVPGNVEGRLLNQTGELRSVYDHRTTLIDPSRNAGTPWIPPRLIRYSLKLNGGVIQVLSTTNRREFAPDLLYLNKMQNRALIDFGAYQLELVENTNRWSINRKVIQNAMDDYFHDLSRNMALNRYFFFNRAYLFEL